MKFRITKRDGSKVDIESDIKIEIMQTIDGKALCFNYHIDDYRINIRDIPKEDIHSIIFFWL